MQSIRVAAVTMNGELGNPEGVFERMAEFCRQAAEQGAELALFPELVVHGHCTPSTWEFAEAVPTGPSTRRLVELAREHRLFLSAGLSEKEHDIVFNTQVLVGPDGYIGKQRKLHLSRDESLFYKGGRDVPVFDIGKCKVGMSICYDNQLPEVPRLCALHGADVILMPHAAREARWSESPESEAAARRHMFELYSSCYAMRARENACFCIVADQSGKAGTVENYPPDHANQPHHAGGAIVFDPLGQVVAHTQLELVREELLLTELDANLLTRARSHPNYTLRTRRPELFGDLAQEQVVC